MEDIPKILTDISINGEALLIIREKALSKSILMTQRKIA